MHTQRAAMQQALEALEALAEFTGSMTLGHRYSNAGQMALDALPALREALAEPVGGLCRMLGTRVIEPALLTSK